MKSFETILEGKWQRWEASDTTTIKKNVDTVVISWTHADTGVKLKSVFNLSAIPVYTYEA